MDDGGLLCYCRAGFEPDLAAELTARAAQAGLAGWARTQRDSGFVVFAGDDAMALSCALPFHELIFARQKLRLLAELRGLDPKDRITPMLEALANAAAAQPGPSFGELVMEHPDSDAGIPQTKTPPASNRWRLVQDCDDAQAATASLVTAGATSSADERIR